MNFRTLLMAKTIASGLLVGTAAYAQTDPAFKQGLADRGQWENWSASLTTSPHGAPTIRLGNLGCGVTLNLTAWHGAQGGRSKSSAEAGIGKAWPTSCVTKSCMSTAAFTLTPTLHLSGLSTTGCWRNPCCRLGLLRVESPLFQPSRLAVWESERHRPGLIANTFIGSVPQHPALGAIIRATARMNDPVWRRTWRIERWRGIRPCFHYKGFLPWQTVGPIFFTKVVRSYCPLQATILPSVLFLPKHFEDKEERQSSVIYARHD
jgi:hypothetical protein